jgi:hypothetical protein
VARRASEPVVRLCFDLRRKADDRNREAADPTAASAFDSRWVAAYQLALGEQIEGEDGCECDRDAGEDSVRVGDVIAGERVDGDGQGLWG